MKDWKIEEGPLGYFGKLKDAYEEFWNKEYGEGNWRLVWNMPNGEIFSLKDIFYRLYLPGYVEYFHMNFSEAKQITDHFAYGYDKTLIDKETAFEPFALVNKPGVPNQFHHVALNLALRDYMGLEFKGSEPLQVREGKPGTSLEEQPFGYRWSPGYIPTARPALIPEKILEGWWKRNNSIEAVYQSTKYLQILIEQ